MLHRIFDQHAERYDSWYQRNTILFECEAKAVRSLDLTGEGLSIGIGTGILDCQAPIEVGVDPSVNMLKLASTRGAEPVRAVGEHLPFKKESFRFVLMTVTVCFLESPGETIREARGVLQAGGYLALCIVPRESSWGKECVKKAKAGHVFYSHANFHTVQEIEEMLKNCSFEAVSVKATLSYPPSDDPRIEEPSEDPEAKGFVCLKALKTSRT